MNLGLKGRVVVVTGGSRGIGRATAEAFGAEGAAVAITYRSNRLEAERTVEAVEQAGGEGLAVHLDLSDFDSIRSAVDRALDRWGRLDILVNNATGGTETIQPCFLDGAPMEEMQEWMRVMRATTEGVLWTIRSAVPAMKANRWGRIVNVSSIAVTDGMPGYAWYASAKASLHGLTKTLAAELGQEGILVNVVMPGATLTDRVQRRFSSQTLEALSSRLPIRRLPLPKEVAAAIVFVCSEKNTVMTGEVFNVSGGGYSGSWDKP